MTTRRFRLDDLVGRMVRDAEGRSVGRVYDMRAEERNGELAIVEYHVGSAALLERVGLSMLRLIGLHRITPCKVPWDRLDISDPDHPVLRS